MSGKSNSQTVYNIRKVCYNLRMKKFAVTALCILAALTAAGGAAAFADTAEPYPTDEMFEAELEFVSVTDYAVSADGEYAFLHDVITEGESVSTVTVHDGKHEKLSEKALPAVALDYDAEDGEFVYGDVEGNVFTLDGRAVDYTLKTFGDTITFDGKIYYLNDGKLSYTYAQGDEAPHHFEGEYSLLKKYGDLVYAVKDNRLYSFEQAAETPIALKYYDYTLAENIPAGLIFDNLKDYRLKFVNVAAQSFVTEIDLDDVSSDSVIKTAGENPTRKTESGMRGLFLCEYGNATVFSVKGKSYITLSSNCTPEYIAGEETDFESGTLTGSKVYTCPFVCRRTEVENISAGQYLKVKSILNFGDVLNAAYYEVEYTDGDSVTHTAYVAEGFLSKQVFEDNKKPVEVPDENESHGNNVRTVVLIMLVVILVLIAAGYLVYVITGGKKKKKTTPDEEEKQTPPEEKE